MMKLTTCCLVMGLTAQLAAGEEKPDRLPWKVNTPIVAVEKELYKKHFEPGAAAVASVLYVGPDLERMEVQGMQSRSDVHSSRRRRYSNDNGRTWSEFQPIPSTDVYYNGREFSEGAGSSVYDPEAGVLVGTWLRQVVGTWKPQAGVDGLFYNSTYYRLSSDHGKTWTAPKQLRYEPGEDFDPKDPLKPGYLKTNQAYPGSNILRHTNGTLIHCVAHANAPGDPNNDKRPWRMGSLCFIGKWNPEAQDYHWTAGNRVEISPDVSSRGLMEPELAELKNGRVLMIWRGSNGGLDPAKSPGRKWFSLSTDGGLTLSEVRELKYDDGSRFYSPSSFHRMIRHSVTGKLYWIGNISAMPSRGNWPRYPLVIGEVDEEIPALKKDTVTAIDDRLPRQTAAIQFSNFSLLEDRQSNALELHLTCYGEFPDNVFTADNYKYTLTLK